MLRAKPDDLRLALLALFSVTGEIGGRNGCCRQTMDRATAAAYSATAETLTAAGLMETSSARFGAALVLNTLCAACRACERGLGLEAEDLTTQPPHPAA